MALEANFDVRNKEMTKSTLIMMYGSLFFGMVGSLAGEGACLILRRGESGGLAAISGALGTALFILFGCVLGAFRTPFAHASLLFTVTQALQYFWPGLAIGALLGCLLAWRVRRWRNCIRELVQIPLAFVREFSLDNSRFSVVFDREKQKLIVTPRRIDNELANTDHLPKDYKGMEVVLNLNG